MKKRVLITLGCSMTEGVGCYVSEYTNEKGEPFENSHHIHEESFHKNGWPNKVGKKMGFDYVINTGCGGVGNTYSYSSFMDWINPSDLEDCDVSVIWLLTEPSRSDIYYEKEMLPVSSNNPYNPWQELYSKAIFSSPTFIEDRILESRLYIRSLKEVCKSRGWNLFILSYVNPDKLLSLKNEIDFYYKGLINTKHPTAFCGHPTEEGYDVISNRIIKVLKNNGWEQKEYNTNMKWIHLKPHQNTKYEKIEI